VLWNDVQELVSTRVGAFDPLFGSSLVGGHYNEREVAGITLL